jgi:hypothetical protein
MFLSELIAKENALGMHEKLNRETRPKPQFIAFWEFVGVCTFLTRWVFELEKLMRCREILWN